MKGALDGPYNSIISHYCHATHYMRERNVTLYCTRITLLIIAMFITYALSSPVTISMAIPNPQETNALFYTITELSMLVGSSETVRVFSTNQSSHEFKDLKIRQ